MRTDRDPDYVYVALAQELRVDTYIREWKEAVERNLERMKEDGPEHPAGHGHEGSGTAFR